ncbi:3'-5' exonuclease [Pseudomonas mohnii]
MQNTDFAWPPEPIIIVDVEGNGHTPPDLVEVGIALFPAVENNETLSWLIKPANRITWQAQRIHGIKNAELENCPSWAEIMGEVGQQLQNRWFVAHNASVDYGVMKRHLPEWSPVGVIDTLKLARHVYPNAKSHRLESLLIETGLRNKVADQLHRAADDAYATALLLDHLIEKSTARTWQDICKIAQLKTQTEDQSPPPEQGNLW